MAAWLDELLTRSGSLKRFAKRGRIVPEINTPAYREICQHPYRIIYRVDGAQVVVLTCDTSGAGGIRVRRREVHNDD